MARADSLDELIILNEVERCTEYAVIAGKVNMDRLVYWRLNRAIDKRYTFKITTSCFATFGILLVDYRGQTFTVKEGKACKC